MVNNNSIYSKIAKTQTDLSDSIDTVSTNVETVNTNVDAVNSSVDSMNNIASGIDEKIGETDDEYDDNTLFGELVANNNIYYTSGSIYPTGTSSTSLTDGSYVEVIPSSTITNPFRIVALLIADIDSTDGWYQFKIAQGASGSEVDIASTAAYRYGNYETRGGYKPITAPVLDANTRISIRLDGAGGTTDIKLVYQEYS